MKTGIGSRLAKFLGVAAILCAFASGNIAIAQDCNSNGIADADEIATTSSLDCNNNGILDECEIAADASLDCNDNDVLDFCELRQPGLLATYYNEMNFTGSSIQRVDPNVNFFWDFGSPDPSIDPDTFSVRWVGKVVPRFTEDYTFIAGSDDGVRLYVNGNLIVDAWVIQPYTEYWSGPVPLQAGVEYDIIMEMFENGSHASATLKWSSPSQAVEIIPTSRLWNDVSSVDCNNNDILDECEIATTSSLDCNNNGVLDECEIATMASLDCNNNDVLDECEIATTASLDCNNNGVLDECEIATTASLDCNNNGVLDECEIAVDPSLDCDSNGLIDSCEIAADSSLDCDGNDVLDICDVRQPGILAAYYNETNFTGSSIQRIDPNINFIWGFGSPDPAIDVDTFSARWIGKVVPLYSENYSFIAGSDDGVRLWVNGNLIIDRWFDQAYTETSSAAIPLQAGVAYDIVMEMYENGGAAAATLKWASNSQPLEIIPTSQLWAPGEPDANLNDRPDICDEADLALVMSDSADPVTRGSQYSYIDTVVNNGPDAAGAVVLTDQLPAGVTFVSASITSGTCSQAGGIVTCNVSVIPAGEAVTAEIIVTADSGGTVLNTASVTNAITDNNPLNNTAGEETTIVDLAPIAHSIGGGNGNGIIDYNECNELSITLENFTPAGVTGISAVLSTNTPNVLVTQPDSAYPDIAPGGTGVNTPVFMISTLPEFECGRVINLTLTLTTDQGILVVPVELETGLHADAVFENNTVTAIPDASGPSASDYGVVDVPIAVSGVTGNVTDVIVSLHITHAKVKDLRLELIGPGGDSVLLASRRGANNGTTANYGVSCENRTIFTDDAALSIAAGTVPFTGEFRPERSLSDFDFVDSNGTWNLRVTDTKSDNTGSVQCVALTLDVAECIDGEGSCPATDLSIEKNDSMDPSPVGFELGYEIIVRNEGDFTANNVVVTDVLPADFTVDSIPTECTVTSDTVTCEIPSMDAGSSITLSITGTPTETGLITNTATVASDVFDIDQSNNTAEETTIIGPATDLAVTKTDLIDPSVVDEPLTYTIVAANNGPDDATGVEVLDTLPGGVIYVSGTATQGSVVESGGVVTVDVGSLAAGEQTTITIEIIPPTGGFITNAVSVSGDQPDPDSSNNADSEETEIGPHVDLAITKIDSADPVALGSNFSYSIEAINLGPDTATSVTIVDTLPAGVTFVSASITSGSVSHAAGVVTAEIDEVPAGHSVSLQIEVTADAVGTVENQVTVVANEDDDDLLNNVAIEGTVISTLTFAIDSIDVLGGNGNGIVDADECNDLTVVLQNTAGVAATGVLVNVSSNTPGVYVTQPNSIYPDIDAGESAANQTPFTISTTLDFVCGQVIDLEFTILTEQGAFAVNASLPTGVHTAASFDSSASVVIPDAVENPFPQDGIADSKILVSGITGNIVDVNVSLHLTHPRTKDLKLFLIAPDGTEVLLSRGRGNGADFGVACDPQTSRTILDDAATAKLAGSVNPFVGAFKPDQALSAFNLKSGAAVNGEWTLHIRDTRPLNEGELVCWSLEITSSDCTDGGGACPTTDLSLSKADTPDPALIGETVTYTIVAVNNGPDDATEVNFIETLPAEAAVLSVSAATGTCSETTGVVSCALGDLAPGQGTTVTIETNYSDAGVYATNSEVSATQFDPDLSDNTAVEETTVQAGADLSISISDSSDPIDAGDVLTYTVIAENAGEDDAASVQIEATLPEDSAFVSAVPASANCVEMNGEVVCDLGSLLAGTTTSVELSIIPRQGPTAVTTASISSEVRDPDLTNNSATEETVVVPKVDLAVEKTGSMNPVPNGGTFDYLIEIFNAGPSTATNTQIVDNLPSELSYVEDDGGCSESGGVVTCVVASIERGTTASLMIRVEAITTGTVVNSATASATEDDTDLSNNTGTEETIIVPGADLELTISDSVDPVLVGTNTTYTLVIANNGPDGATSVTLADTLALGTVLDSVNPTTGTCSVSGDLVICELGDLAVGESTTVSLGVTFPTEGVFVNSGSVFADQLDPHPANNFASEETAAGVPVIQFAGFDITGGGDGDGIIEIDECHDLTVDLTNNGIIAATGVTATISSLTPGVTVLQNSSAYPDIAPGATEQNLTAYTICTDETFVCGRVIEVDVLVQTNELVSELSFSLPTGTEHTKQFHSNETVAIADATDTSPSGYSVTTAPLEVRGMPGALTDVDVSLHIEHARIGDIIVELVSPDGQAVLLAHKEAGSSTNFGIACGPEDRTAFDDSSTTPIQTGSDPFVGSYQPREALSALREKSGLDLNEVWQLRITDTRPDNDGVLHCWSLAVTTARCSPAADLSVEIADSPDPANQAEPFNYLVTVRNDGPDTATLVQLTDSLSTGVTFIAASSTSGTCTHNAGVIECALDDIPANGSVEVSIDVSSADTGTFVNTAAATAAEDDADLSNNMDTEETTVQPNADVSISKTASPEIVNEGQPLTYTIQVGNNGPGTAVDVTMVDALTTGLAFDSVTTDQGSCTEDSGVVTCDLGSIAVGSTVTVELVVIPGVTGTVSNTAAVTSSGNDPDLSNNVSTVESEVSVSVDLVVSISDSPDPGSIGQPVTYAVTVLNNGPGDATSVTLINTLPTGVLFGSASPSQGSCAQSGDTVTCDLGSLASGSSAGVNIAVTPSQTGVITNVATATSFQIESNESDNTATENTMINGVTEIINDTFDEFGDWTTIGLTLMDPALSQADYDGGVGAYRIHTFASTDKFRVAGWVTLKAAWLPYTDVGTDNYVRSKFYVYTQRSPGFTSDLQYPNFKLRVANRFAVTAEQQIMTHDQYDPANLENQRELRPSTDPLNPSVYRVDFDPIDVPYLQTSTTGEGILHGFESFTLDPTDDNILGLTESSLGVYPAELLADENALQMKVYAPTATDAGNLKLYYPTDLLSINFDTSGPPPPIGGMWPIETEGELATVSEGPFGVTIDSTNVPFNRMALLERYFFAGNPDGTAGYADRIRISENKLFKVRWHVTSTRSTSEQAWLLLQQRSVKFGWSMALGVAGAFSSGHPAGQAIARQSLPGVGSMNPDQMVSGENGGWYTVIMNSPMHRDIRPEFPDGTPLETRMPAITSWPGPGEDAPSIRDVKLSAKIYDTISFEPGKGTEAALFTIDRIEVRAYDMVSD